MNILFLTIGKLESIEARGIYPDLLRVFRDKGYSIYTVSPYEKRTGKRTELTEENGVRQLRVAIGNITKCGFVEKGISTIQIQSKFLTAIKKYYADVKFDLVLYSTPPITFSNVIEYIKKRDNAKSYLILKDIFPQNAVDLGMISKRGLKAPIYWYFRKKEQKLYALSDRIGCMSQANVDYLLKHNTGIDPAIVELCPNSVQVQDLRLSAEERLVFRKKYCIPVDKKVFVYGGNLGKPQGISFIIECLKAQRNKPDAFFLIIGDGTEYGKLAAFLESEPSSNVKLMKRLPKEDYDRLVAACDVGLVFLDYRFTIPNFPSRLLSYMQAGLPVLCCTDPNTDVGKVCEEGGFGWWCKSNSTADFATKIQNALNADLVNMGERAFDYLKEHYTSQKAYEVIMALNSRVND